MNTHGKFERGLVARPGGATPAPGAGSPANEDDAVPIGTLIAGKYRVERVLGEGMMEMTRALSDDPNAEEPLPSTRPQGRVARMREARLATAAPAAVVAEGDAARPPESDRTHPASG